MLWEFKDKLKKEVSNQAMKGLLQFNNQEVVNSESKLLERLSDCMVFGAIPRCSECEGGQLVFRYYYSECVSARSSLYTIIGQSKSDCIEVDRS